MYWQKMKMPFEKLVLGIATYGYGYTLSDPSNYGMGAPGSAAPPQPYTKVQGIAAYYEVERGIGERPRSVIS